MLNQIIEMLEKDFQESKDHIYATVIIEDVELELLMYHQFNKYFALTGADMDNYECDRREFDTLRDLAIAINEKNFRLPELKEEEEEEEYYTPSSTFRDYSPGNPWDAPGMSISDFI